jgi:hypothetical protein
MKASADGAGPLFFIFFWRANGLCLSPRQVVEKSRSIISKRIGSRNRERILLEKQRYCDASSCMAHLKQRFQIP